MMVVVRLTLVVCVILYLAISVFGYMLFRTKTKGNVLDNFTANQYPFITYVKVRIVACGECGHVCACEWRLPFCH